MQLGPASPGQPQRLFDVARLLKPDGPSLCASAVAACFPLHMRWYGRHCPHLMYKLNCASVRSAYATAEREAMVRADPLPAPLQAQPQPVEPRTMLGPPHSSSTEHSWESSAS